PRARRPAIDGRAPLGDGRRGEVVSWRRTCDDRLGGERWNATASTIAPRDLATERTRRMTTQQDFTPAEWEQVLEGPTGAGLLVITAQRGGLWRETLSMAKAYAEARQQHGQSELLDAIVAAKPKLDHTRYHSPQELNERSLAHLRDAVALLE